MKKTFIYILMVLLLGMNLLGCKGTNASLNSAEDPFPGQEDEEALDNWEAVPEGEELDMAGLPETKEQAILVEDQEQMLEFSLYENKELGFYTYVPQDMIETETGDADSVRFTASFAGQQDSEMYMEFSWYQETIADQEEAASRLLQTAEAKGWEVTEEPDGVEMFPWALQIFSIVNPQDGSTGTLWLGEHGGRYFQFIVYVPETDSEGLYPRVEAVFSDFFWLDSEEYLNTDYQSFQIQQEADDLMREFINAVNMGDEQAVLNCMDPRMKGYYTTETVKAALEDYDHYFEGQEIVGFEIAGDHPHMPSTLVYKITNEKGIDKEVLVIYQDDVMRVYDDFLGYSYKAKQLLQSFTHILSRRDPADLVRVLTVDDLPYPMEKTQSILQAYEEHMDLEEIEFKFVSLNVRESSFVYSIYGKKNGKTIEHEVKVIFGDGLVKILDPWVPAIP